MPFQNLFSANLSNRATFPNISSSCSFLISQIDILPPLRLERLFSLQPTNRRYHYSLKRGYFFRNVACKYLVFLERDNNKFFTIDKNVHDCDGRLINSHEFDISVGKLLTYLCIYIYKTCNFPVPPFILLTIVST